MSLDGWARLDPATAITPSAVEQQLLRQPSTLVALVQYINCRSLPSLALAAMRLFAELAVSPRFEAPTMSRGSTLVGR